MGKKGRETSRQGMALLLMAAMCISLLPATVLAADRETAEEDAEEIDGGNYVKDCRGNYGEDCRGNYGEDSW